MLGLPLSKITKDHSIPSHSYPTVNTRFGIPDGKRRPRTAVVWEHRSSHCHYRGRSLRVLSRWFNTFFIVRLCDGRTGTRIPTLEGSPCVKSVTFSHCYSERLMAMHQLHLPLDNSRLFMHRLDTDRCSHCHS